MSWSAAIQRSIRYLPQIGGLYFVCWLIFSLASWLLIQALRIDSALWVMIAGLQYCAGALVAVGGTLAFGIKVIADTLNNPESDSESNLILPSGRTVIGVVAAIIGLIFIITLLANLESIITSAKQIITAQHSTEDTQPVSRTSDSPPDLTPTPTPIPASAPIAVPIKPQIGVVTSPLIPATELDVTRLRGYVVQWLLDSCTGNLPGEEANFSHYQLAGFNNYEVQKLGDYTWAFTSGSETWNITESPTLEVTNPRGNAWCLK